MGRSGGFTLIEIVVAIGILAISLMGIIAISGSAIDSTREAEENFQAVQIAANAFDELRSTTFTAPTTFPPRYFDDQAQPLAETQSVDAIYRIDIEATEAPARPGQSTLHARVTYPWLGSFREGQSSQLFTTVVFLSPEILP